MSNANRTIDLAGTQILKAADGTAAAPSITNDGDTNTGMFFPAADTIAFAEGGSEAMRIDSSGNVGIGTTSPSNRLHIVNSGAGALALQTTQASSDQTQIRFIGTTGDKWAIGNNAATGGTGTNFDIYDIASGANRLRIDSSGNLNIGSYHSGGNGGRLTSEGELKYRLSTSEGVYGFGTAGMSLQTTSNHPIIFGTNNTERLRIDSSGNLNIGSYHSGGDGGRLTSDGELKYRLSTSEGVYGFGTAGMSLQTTSNHPIIFGTNNTERLRITSGGLVLIGCTASPSSSVSGVLLQNPLNGSSTFSLGSYTGSATVIAFVNGNGTIGSISVNGSATAYNTSSDYRLKTNLEPISNGIARLKQLPVYRFNWLSDANGNKVDGFVAHEAQAIVPECVTGEKDAVDADGNSIYQGIDQSKIVPLLTAALKEAIAKIETLEAKVAALEAA